MTGRSARDLLLNREIAAVLVALLGGWGALALVNRSLAQTVGLPVYRVAHGLTTGVLGCRTLFPCAFVSWALVVPVVYVLVAPVVAIRRLATADG